MYNSSKINGMIVYSFTIKDNNTILKLIEDTYIEIYNELIDYRNINIGSDPTLNNLKIYCSYGCLIRYITSHNKINYWLSIFNKTMINDICKKFNNDHISLYKSYSKPYKKLPSKIDKINKILISSKVIAGYNNLQLFDKLIIDRYIDNTDIERYKLHINVEYLKEYKQIKTILKKTYKKYYLIVYINNKVSIPSTRIYRNKKTIIKFDKNGFLKNMSKQTYSLDVNLSKIADKIEKLSKGIRVSKTDKYTSKEIISNINFKLDILLRRRYLNIIRLLVRKYDFIYISKLEENKLPKILKYIKTIKDLYFNLINNINSEYTNYKYLNNDSNNKYINTGSKLINVSDYEIFRCKRCNNLNVIYKKSIVGYNLYCYKCNQNKYTYMKNLVIEE